MRAIMPPPRLRRVTSRAQRQALAARARAERLRRLRARTRGRARARRALDAGSLKRQAQHHLRRFRQASTLAVALSALLLLLWGGADAGAELQEPASQPVETAATEVTDPAVAVDQATQTMRDLAQSFYGFLPRLAMVLILFAVAALIARLLQAILRRTVRGWERLDAVPAVARLLVYALAAVVAISVLAGDVRAAVGSVGLLGLAASWALQTPIESFTGWLLNSFRGYYRVGDRIGVGDVFGDVYRIDVLTTTVWEAGGAGKPVAAAQPTGALITFPNWEVLRSNIVNYTRDFPFVWDEVTFNVTNDSDLGHAASVIEAVTRRTLGQEMADAAHRYEELLRAARLSFEVEELPRVYLSLADSWTECTVRYVVPVRTRRKWASALILAVSEELARPEHSEKVVGAYPRTDVSIIRDS